MKKVEWKEQYASPPRSSTNERGNERFPDADEALQNLSEKRKSDFRTLARRERRPAASIMLEKREGLRTWILYD